MPEDGRNKNKDSSGGHGYPAYDDDKFYDVESVVSAHDCTGLVPTPPKSESEAESYSDLLNFPQPKGEVDNGFQRINPKKARKESDRSAQGIKAPPSGRPGLPK